MSDDEPSARVPRRERRAPTRLLDEVSHGPSGSGCGGGEFAEGALRRANVNPPQYSPHAPQAMVNRDTCDSCGEGGDLLCCDNCPARCLNSPISKNPHPSFHFDCINPPVDASSMPPGDYYCNRCTALLVSVSACGFTALQYPPQSPPVGGPMAPLLGELPFVNPMAYSLPTGLRDAVEGSRRRSLEAHDDQWGGDEDVVITAFHQHESVCSVCLKSGPSALCGTCPRAFHLTCLEPPLASLPSSTWTCKYCELSPKHRRKRARPFPSVPASGTFVLPAHSLPLDFSKKKDEPEPKKIAPEPDDIITDLPPCTEHDDLAPKQPLRPRLQFSELHRVRDSLLAQSLPTPPTNYATLDHPAQIGDLLTPLFTQFLAWQRLMQVNRELADRSSEAPKDSRRILGTFASIVAEADGLETPLGNPHTGWKEPTPGEGFAPFPTIPKGSTVTLHGPGFRHVLTKILTIIGRGGAVDVDLGLLVRGVSVKRVSHRHAYIILDSGRIELLNNGRNGTFVNGARIPEGRVPVTDGDAFEIGGIMMTLKVEA